MSWGKWRSSPAFLEWQSKLNRKMRLHAHSIPFRVFATQPEQVSYHRKRGCLRVFLMRKGYCWSSSRSSENDTRMVYYSNAT